MTTENEINNQELLYTLKDFMSRSMYAKTEMCKEEPMSDCPPIAIVSHGDKDDDSIAVIPLIHSGDVREALSDVISAMPVQKFNYMALSLEGYHDTALDGKMPDDYERNDLAKDFKENPFTTVREGLIINGVDWEHKYSITGHVEYTYDDRGVPSFGEVSWTEESSDDVVGIMSIILVKACKYMQAKILAKSFADLLEEAPIKKKEKKSDDVGFI